LLDDEINVSCLKRSAKCEKTVKKHLFKTKNPLKEPAFFNFFSHHDVNRIGSQLDLEIVIYTAPNLKSKRDFIYILHDFRCLQGTTARDVRYYLYLTDSGSLRSLTEPLSLISEKIFFSSDAKVYGTTDSANSSLISALDALVRTDASTNSFDQAAPLPSLTLNAYELQGQTDLLYRRWNKTVIVVGFCRLFKKGSWNAKKKFSDCYFVTLALVTSPENKKYGCTLEDLGIFIEHDKPIVLVLYNQEIVCKMTSAFTEELLTNYRDARDRKEKISGRNFMDNKKISTTERLAAYKVWKEKRLKHRKRKSNERQKSIGRICKCQICNSEDFSENMASSGPEQLCSTSYSITELLRMLGALDKDTERNVDRMCELSIATMDIESKTVKADVGTPSHGDPIEYCQIDSSKLEGFIKKVQKPIMIAHSDGLVSLHQRQEFLQLIQTLRQRFLR